MTKQEKIDLLRLLLNYLKDMNISYEKSNNITIDELIELLMNNYMA